MSAYKFPFVSMPFKGNWYYEAQVGPVVLMWQHATKHVPTSGRGLRLGRFYVWSDKDWWREASYRLRRFCRRISR